MQLCGYVYVTVVLTLLTDLQLTLAYTVIIIMALDIEPLRLQNHPCFMLVINHTINIFLSFGPLVTQIALHHIDSLIMSKEVIFRYLVQVSSIRLGQHCGVIMDLR